jgi:polyhydroxyalkanoate synthase
MTEVSPASILDRVRLDVERNALRARNGIRLAAGLSRPKLGTTPKDVVWRRGRCELWHYRNDDVRVSPPLLIVFSLFSRSYILDLLVKTPQGWRFTRRTVHPDPPAAPPKP